MKIIIRGDGRVVVHAPKSLPLHTINEIVRSKKEWILEASKKISSLKRENIATQYPYQQYRMRARKFIMQKVRVWNEIYQHKYERITIRNQSSRWGSCSSKGTLSFSYKLLFLPEELADYIVVHELCHLKEMNHSRKFWLLVAATMPQYKKMRIQLHRFSLQ